MRHPIRRDTDPPSSLGRPRRGAVGVVALVCLVLIALIGANLLRTGLAQRRRIQEEERRLQAGWLAESGLERAAVKLAGDPGYRGETWPVPAAELGGPWSGAVTIIVEPVPEATGRRAVRVRADYPDRADRRARQHREAIIDLGPGAREERP